MKFSAIRHFLAVAERGSLRAAARQLDAAQAAISYSIQELEKELGVALFERRSTGVVLTQMGQVFHARATLIANEVRRAQEEMDQMRGQAHGHITVAMSSVPHIALLPNALQPFRQRFPKITMDLIDAVYPGVESRLLDGSVDCYFGPAPVEIASGLSVEKLFDNTRVIVGRKGHPLANATRLKDLAEAEWITTSITHNATEELGPLFAQYGLPAPRLVMKSHSTLTFLTSMVYSDLLMMLPIQWTQSTLFSEKVQQIKLHDVIPAPPVSLIKRNGLPLTPAAEYFCDMMRRAVLHMNTVTRS